MSPLPAAPPVQPPATDTPTEQGTQAGTGALVASPPGPDGPQWTERLRDGTHVLIRPIRASDLMLEREFLVRLSPQARRYRFLGEVRELDEEQLRRFTAIDYVRDVAFVALVHEDGEKREVGVSRYSVVPDTTTCECAVVVADAWQHRGLGTLLVSHLMQVARQRGLRRMFSIDAADNVAMRELAHFLGFERHADPDDATQVIHSVTL